MFFLYRSVSVDKYCFVDVTVWIIYTLYVYEPFHWLGQLIVLGPVINSIKHGRRYRDKIWQERHVWAFLQTLCRRRVQRRATLPAGNQRQERPQEATVRLHRRYRSKTVGEDRSFARGVASGWGTATGLGATVFRRRRDGHPMAPFAPSPAVRCVQELRMPTGRCTGEF